MFNARQCPLLIRAHLIVDMARSYVAADEAREDDERHHSRLHEERIIGNPGAIG